MQPAIRTEPAAPPRRTRGRPRKTLEEQGDGNRRGELLRTAARLFHRKGFDATSTRDIAAAAGMRSGSPFYHFKSKGALLFAVMEEGMRSAIAQQGRALELADLHVVSSASVLRLLIRNHFDVLLGPGSDFVPVMLYEARSITPRQRISLAALQREYEAPWMPVLDALHACGRLRAEVKIARLLIFGALNWSAQWYDRRKGATLDELADSAVTLFIGDAS